MADWKDNPTLQRLLGELARDKKKATILGVLLVVCLVMGIRMLARGGGASPAEASPIVTAGTSPTTAIKAVPEPVDVEANAKARRDQYIKSMAGNVARDLFATDMTLFPVVRVAPSTATSKPSTATATTSTITQAELDREAVKIEARGLVLESTMVGSSSVASINGKILHVGDVLGGFAIVDITAHSCVVRKKGVTLSLEIRK